MRSSADSPAPGARRSDLLTELTRRLESAERLTAEMHRALLVSDAEAIDDAGARLRTVATECKLLHEEYGRFPAVEDPDPGFAAARADFERVAVRVARSAAVSGGLLERLVDLSRRLIDSLAGSEGETYGAGGRSRERAIGGLGLRELA